VSLKKILFRTEATLRTATRDSGDAAQMHAYKSAPWRASRADFASATEEPRDEFSATVHDRVQRPSAALSPRAGRGTNKLHVPSLVKTMSPCKRCGKQGRRDEREGGKRREGHRGVQMRGGKREGE
jgi:hypothetical protein